MRRPSPAMTSQALARQRRPIGVIVNSDSHIHYWCQVYGTHEIADPPTPQEYAFGQFVQIDLPGQEADGGAAMPVLIGVIYDTVLVNPAFGSLGPRLSTSDEQRAIFSPDYLTERATLLRVLALGTGDVTNKQMYHGVPALALELGANVRPCTDDDVRAFHFFADDGPPGGDKPYLHMGYLPQLIGQPSGLLPQTALCILDQLQALFPAHIRLLSIVRRNLAWKLSVETAG
jgi:hypothetical protein